MFAHSKRTMITGEMKDFRYIKVKHTPEDILTRNPLPQQIDVQELEDEI